MRLSEHPCKVCWLSGCDCECETCTAARERGTNTWRHGLRAMGFGVVADATMPPDTVDLRYGKRVVGRITDLQPTSEEGT